jgi:cellulose biosynthesis protein BcsQ
LASTSLLIPLQLDLFSLEGLTELIKFVETSEVAHAKKLIHIVGGVATMVDMGFKWGLSYSGRFPKVAAGISRLNPPNPSSTPFWCATLRQRGDFRKAQAQHKSVLAFAPSSDAASDLRELKEEVVQRVHAVV